MCADIKLSAYIYACVVHVACVCAIGFIIVLSFWIALKNCFGYIFTRCLYTLRDSNVGTFECLLKKVYSLRDM